MQLTDTPVEAPRIRAFEVNNRMVLGIAVPMTLAFLTTPLLGLVDTAVVGRLGDAALIGGLAMAAILFDLVFSTFNFLRSATTGLVAQAMGREDPTEEQAVFWRSLMISVVAGIAVIAAIPLLLKLGLPLLGARGEVAAAASTYACHKGHYAANRGRWPTYAMPWLMCSSRHGGTGRSCRSNHSTATNIVPVRSWLGLGLDYGLKGVGRTTYCRRSPAAVAASGCIHR